VPALLIAWFQIIGARRGIPPLWLGRCRSSRGWRRTAGLGAATGPGPGVAVRPRRRDLETLPEAPPPHPAPAPPNPPVRQRGRAAPGRLARAHHQHRLAAVLLEGLDRARDGDQRAVAQRPDAADLIAADAVAERAVFGAARIGVGREPFAQRKDIAA